MYIGHPNLYIGSTLWYIGSSGSSLPEDTDVGQGNGSPQDLFIFRNVNRHLITSLEAGEVEPDQDFLSTLNIQYRGHKAIRVLGLYIRPTREDRYLGSSQPNKDYDTLLKWGSYFSNGASPGQPGIELTQTNYLTELEETYLVRYGLGDTEFSPVPYISTENGILLRDQSFQVRLGINLPSAEAKQVLKAGKFDFELAISFIELPANQQIIPGDEC